MLRLSHVEDVGLPPGLPGARDMAIEDPEMFGLSLPPGLPGAVSMPTPEDFEMFGLGHLGEDGLPAREGYDATGRAKLFFHGSISQAIIGAVGYGIFAKSKSAAIKTAGAVVVGIALSKILANGYQDFVPTDKPKTLKEDRVAKTQANLELLQAQGKAGTATGQRQPGNQPQMMPFI